MHTNVFGDFGTTEILNECEKHNINIDSMRHFIPFVTVVWYNSKGRMAFTVMNTDVVREPLVRDWCTTEMSVDEILEKIRHKGGYKTNNEFFRAQSGYSTLIRHKGGYKTNNEFFRAQSSYSTLREEQRPGVPYFFRHDILIHKTRVFWKQMSKRDDRRLRCQGRDIHLVPIQFLVYDPQMLRDYRGRILLFNMYNEDTRRAFETARETPNGYIQVSQDINLDRLEAVFNLDRKNKEFAYDPVAHYRRNAEQGIGDASHLLHYYSKVIHKEAC